MSFDLPEGWEWKPFEKLLEIPLRNGIYKKKEFHGRGAKIVNMGELFAHTRLKDVDMKRVELTEKELEKSSLESGDLIFARRSLTAEGAGKCTIVLEVNEPTTFESSIIRARLNKKIADPEFYYYLFNSKFGKWLLGTILRQVAVAGITGTDLAKLQIPVPPLSTQNEIAKNGSSLDEKIELNRQINQTLEQIAQALFKSWFVDFEPVKAKIQAKKRWQAENETIETSSPTCYAAEFDDAQNSISLADTMNRAAMRAISGKTDEQLDLLSPEQRQQLAATAALFPDELVDSELGEAPRGWGKRRIDQILELAYGKALKKTERYLGNVPVYGSGGVTGVHNMHLVDGPGVIVGRKGTVGSLHWEDSNFFPIDTVFYVVPKVGFSLEYIYYLLQTLGLENMNTDAAVPGLNRNNVYRLVVAAHPIKLVEMYSKVVSSFANQMSANKKECTTLVGIRDSLLPRLLSGELEIQEVA